MSYFEGAAGGAEVRKGLEALAKATKEAAEIKAKAVTEDSILDGKTAYANRVAQARTEGLRMALANLDGNPNMETITEYAEQFANYILFGTQDSAPAFPGKQV